MNAANENEKGIDRRGFLEVAAATTVAVGLPNIVGAEDKSGSKPPVIGEGEHKYEAIHDWGELPSRIKYGDTHDVCVDSAGMIYITHMVHKTSQSGDTIVVFDPEGKFVASWGSEFRGGGHGLDLRKEGNEEFLYHCFTTQGTVAKTTLKGDFVWKMKAPPEAEVYKDGRNGGYVPTNVAFLPSGGFVVADGYGRNYIHEYDKDAKWVKTWGGPGKGPGKFTCCHGIWLDDRDGAPKLVITDRGNARIAYYTLDGKHLTFQEGFRMPAHFDIRGKELLVPDLKSRLTILDAENKPVAQLGGDEISTLRDKPRSEWIPGKFIHPHDACYDADGNIFVVEWVPTGRVTKLRKVA